MNHQLKQYDGADFLESDEDIAEYLNLAWQEQDPTYFMTALGNVAKTKGVANLAEETGLNRESLYKTFSGNRDARLGTLIKILSVLNIRVAFRAA